MLEARGHQLDRLRVRAFPFHSSVAELHRRPRLRVRRRAEPRRAAAHPDRQRARHRSGAARPDPALRRHADHRALHRQAPSATISTAQSHPAPQGRVMTYIAKPKFHHPGAAEERARLHAPRLRGQGFHAVRRLRPRLHHRRDHRGLLRALDRAAPGGEDFRHRLLVEDAGLFPRQFARLQHRARPHAVGADRRQPRQPRPDLSRRVGRRRQRLDRLRPVRALDPARRQHDLHRREQRRLRPDQGPVLGHRRPRLQEQARRGQFRQLHRSGGDGAAARRELRRPLVLRRQDPARAADRSARSGTRARPSST